jgi:Rrf2 family protein
MRRTESVAMELTRASNYVIAAAVYLAHQKGGKPATSQVIAEAEGLPEPFLHKLLKPLVDVGLLRSLKGPNGGYTLARPAKDITLLEIVEAVDGPIRGQVPEFEHGDRRLERKLQAVCVKMAEAVRQRLRKVTLADLAAER